MGFHVNFRAIGRSFLVERYETDFKNGSTLYLILPSAKKKHRPCTVLGERLESLVDFWLLAGLITIVSHSVFLLFLALIYDRSYERYKDIPRTTYVLHTWRQFTSSLGEDMPTIIDGRHVLSESGSYAIIWTFTSFSIVTTALRLYGRSFVVKSLGLDDALISFSLVRSIQSHIS